MLDSVGVNFDLVDEISDSAGNSHVPTGCIVDSTCEVSGSVYFFQRLFYPY